MNIYIDDGQTQAKNITGRAGFYPDVSVQFRPALTRKRHEYRQRLDVGDPAKTDAWESELLEKHVVSLNGDPIPPGKGSRIIPELRKLIIDLILGYESSDDVEAANLKN